jgi:ribosomal silencing factor RsfS
MSDNLLSNVVVLDVSSQSSYFDHFIIGTGMTSQHLQSSGNTITKYLKTLNFKILYIY